VVAGATLDDLMIFISESPTVKKYEAAVARYRLEYGVAGA
jgi:hypothetical protein